MWHKQAERSGAEYRDPYHYLASVTVTHRSSYKSPNSRGDHKHKQEYLGLRHTDTELIYQIERIIARQ